MKFSIKKDEAISIISEYMNILKENPVKPILSALFITTKNDRVIFKGCNTEMELVKYSDCKTELEGSVLIKPSLLLEYIKLIEENEINFEKKNGYLIVNNAEFTILDELSYPEIIELSTVIITKQNGIKFSKLLEKVKFVSSSINSDPLFSSVNIIFSNDSIEFVSTDSYRLVYLKEANKNTVEKEAIVPNESANIIHKLLKDLDEDVSISVNDNKLILTYKNSYFSCKLLSLSFPDYKSLLSNFKSDKTFEFNREEFSSALKRVISVTKNNVDSKYVSNFNFKGSFLNISGFSSSAKVNQKVNMMKNGDDINIGLNCKYIKDFTDNLEKNIIIKASTPNSMLEVLEEDNSTYIYLIMPVNIRA